MESKVVNINVGGTIFQTTELTLSKSKFFQTFLENGKDIPFVDRDPEYFKLILNYLRGGPLICSPQLSFTQLELEAAYFALPLPLEDFGTGPDAKKKQIKHQQWMKGVPGECKELVGNGCIYESGSTQILWNGNNLSKPYGFNEEILPCDFREEPSQQMAINRLLRHFLKYGWHVKQMHVDANNRWKSWYLCKT